MAPQIKSKLHQYQVIQENTKTLEKAKSGTKEVNKKALPSTYYLEVNFICQAPLETTENWKLHEESCEEAALLQAYLYEKSQVISKEEANEVILDMIEWQRRNFGGHYDLHGEKMKDFILQYYKLKESSVTLIQDGEIEDIKKIVSSGHPAIVPVTGEILNNPYYPYPGYHMLIVIGYTEDRIITNDNGTKRGADFSYEVEVFNAAFKDAGGEIFVLNID
ncbi:C39 family peptidase [Candidatus Peregrinibacteria bacterium]|nr:C39 family peptidase [Candidatus Peregrinibacteria bacterium]